MINNTVGSQPLSNADLLTATRELVRRSHGVEADLLVHLGEVDERKLYLDCAFPSMFAFCVGELGFSEDAAYNRITVARAARRFPALIEAVRAGRVHLAGLRLLAPHLTTENHVDVLARAAGKSKREVEELVACLAPQPPVAATSRELRNKLREAQDLLRLQNPTGDMALIFERALDLLLDQVRKERFAVGRKPRQQTRDSEGSRHIPGAVKRAVYERDGGRCTFVDDRGRRCAETGALELDHIDGFARTGQHDADRIRLLCRAHVRRESGAFPSGMKGARTDMNRAYG